MALLWATKIPQKLATKPPQKLALAQRGVLKLHEGYQRCLNQRLFPLRTPWMI